MPTFRLYCRRSKRERLLNKLSCSIETQIEKCLMSVQHDLVHKFPGTDTPSDETIYIDDGVSASKPLGTRPAGSRLLWDLCAGDVLVMTKWDRGFRNMLDYLQNLQKWQAKGCLIFVVDAPFDLTTRAGRLAAKMSALLAEEEWELARERALDAQAMRRRHGLAVGMAPIGYKNEGPAGYRRVVPDHDERAVIEKMAELRLKGLSLGQIYNWFWTQALLAKDLSEQKHYLLPRNRKPPSSPTHVKQCLDARAKGYPIYGKSYAEMLSQATADVRDLYEDKSLAVLAKMGYNAASREAAGEIRSYTKNAIKCRKRRRVSNRSIT